MSEEVATVTTTTPATAETTTVQTTAPVQAAAPAAETKPANPTWYEKFPSKYRNNGEPDVEKLITGYEHLQTKLSSKGYAPAADVAEFDYTPKNFAPAPEQYEAFKAQALELGLNKTQFNALLEMHDNEMATVFLPPEAAQAKMEEFWGRDYKTNIGAAQRAFKEFSDDTIDAEDPILNHPTVLKLLAAVGSQLGEDSQNAPASAPRGGLSESEVNSILASGKHWNDPALYKQVEAYYAKNSK